jgi:hypothetical protein
MDEFGACPAGATTLRSAKMRIHALLFSLIATVSVSSAGEVTIGRLRVTLPDGYRHVPGKGFDTAVGCFQPDDGSCEIRYDIGPGAGFDRAKEFAEKHAEQLSLDKKIVTMLGEGRFVAIRLDDKAKFAVVFEAQAGVIFSAINLTKQQVDDFESIASSLVVLPKPNPKKLEAEPTGAGQPATRPVEKPEGGVKPQPEAEGRSR